jgi:hypothetical protein
MIVPLPSRLLPLFAREADEQQLRERQYDKGDQEED